MAKIDVKEKYIKTAVPQMMQLFGYKNKMAVPGILKVVLNSGFGKLIAEKGGDEQKKIIEEAKEALTLISGQKAALTIAKKSIAGFKVREGSPQGVKVTLRGQRMYDFLERLLSIVFPRMRDFKGLDPSLVDEKGSLSMGMKEHTFFPEVPVEKVKTSLGLEFTVVTNAKTKKEGLELLKLLGFPFKV
ncbi:MAG: large subunit ribosomal protein L5 [Parcubacteria group bacterium Greene0714_21]|nr:MAG: large subunit ribosomal protein L5 [Parcubacteria group bacterium Greene0416_39]TSC97707.1 MAG: large subunit ribosomal protein L5 [Parcubacteria group bacterium Greene1014_47]TSD04370.1 MAG: large subunit ribosomal protein L5 [Parcubacteria group bacterium Greene0714_21]